MLTAIMPVDIVETGSTLRENGLEDLARERAKELFGCEYVNVQPHSGAQANMAVFFAILNPGDTFMGMNRDSCLFIEFQCPDHTFTIVIMNGCG